MPMKRLLLISCLGLTACSTLVKQEDTVNDPRFDNPQTTEDGSPLPAPELDNDNPLLLSDSEVPPFVPNLWEHLASEQSFANVQHPRIDAFREQYLKSPHLLLKRADKAAPYLYYIITELENRNMPVELAFTPMVESNFDPWHTRSFRLLECGSLCLKQRRALVSQSMNGTTAAVTL